MKTQNNKLVALIEMHASANENGQDALCNALYHAINELAKTIGYKGENACDELSSNGELEIDGVCYQFDGKTILTSNTLKSKQITKDVEIINNNNGQWAALKISGGNVINSRSWVSKPVAVKRANLLQSYINDGLIKA
jgi:hypothetical protein